MFKFGHFLFLLPPPIPFLFLHLLLSLLSFAYSSPSCLYHCHRCVQCCYLQFLLHFLLHFLFFFSFLFFIFLLQFQFWPLSSHYSTIICHHRLSLPLSPPYFFLPLLLTFLFFSFSHRLLLIYTKILLDLVENLLFILLMDLSTKIFIDK